MTQQNSYYGEDTVYKRKLFYDNGLRFLECKGRMVNEYKPPTPVVKSQANAVLQASAGLVQGGTSHYIVTVTLLFYSKKEYADWIQFVGAEHKYYDEKGSVYVGVVNGEPDIKTVEQETKYLVSVSLLMIRKQEFEFRQQSPFIDMGGHWAEQYAKDMQERGIIAVYDYNGDPVQYFRPEDHLLRSEGAAFMLRSFRMIEKLLRGY